MVLQFLKDIKNTINHIWFFYLWFYKYYKVNHNITASPVVLVVVSSGCDKGSSANGNIDFYQWTFCVKNKCICAKGPNLQLSNKNVEVTLSVNFLDENYDGTYSSTKIFNWWKRENKIKINLWCQKLMKYTETKTIGRDEFGTDQIRSIIFSYCWM